MFLIVVRKLLSREKSTRNDFIQMQSIPLTQQGTNSQMEKKLEIGNLGAVKSLYTSLTPPSLIEVHDPNHPQWFHRPQINPAVHSVEGKSNLAIR